MTYTKRKKSFDWELVGVILGFAGIALLIIAALVLPPMFIYWIFATAAGMGAKAGWIAVGVYYLLGLLGGSKVAIR